jgi:hypothetical protein
MSRTHQRSLTPNSVASSSRFKEHLSISMPPPNQAIERSHFSPDSSPGHSERDSTIGGSTVYGSSRPRPLDPRRASQATRACTAPHRASETASPASFSTSEMSLRDGSRSTAPPLPSGELPPKMPDWPPLNIRKPAPQCACNNQQSPARRRALLVALAVFLLYLFINVTVLNVRSFASPKLPTVTPSASAPTTTETLSANTQQCIAQYTLDAPSNPTGVPMRHVSSPPRGATAKRHGGVSRRTGCDAVLRIKVAVGGRWSRGADCA